MKKIKIQQASSLFQQRLAVCFTFFVNGIVFGGWAAHIPSMQTKFSLSEAHLGSFLLVMGLGAVVVMPLSGWLSCRFGSFYITMFASLGYALSLPLLFLVPSVCWLTIAIFLFGAANGSMDVAMNDQAIMVEKRYKRPIMSTFHAFFSIGGLTGAVIAAIILSLDASPSQQAIGTTVFVFIVAVIVFPWLIKESPLPAPKNKLKNKRKFTFNNKLALFALLTFMVFMSEGAIADWSALYMRDYLFANASTSALAYAAFSLMMMIGRLSGDLLVQRIGRPNMMAGGSVLVIMGMATVLLTSHDGIAILGFALVGAGLANLVPILFSLAGNLPSIAPSIGVATVSVTGYSGFLLGPPSLGFFAHAVNLPTALSIILLFGFFVLIVSHQVDSC